MNGRRRMDVDADVDVDVEEVFCSALFGRGIASMMDEMFSDCLLCRRWMMMMMMYE